MKSTNSGVSLFEIIITVAIFATVAILTTRSTFLTLRGSKKSDSQIKVKENLEYGLGVVERQLRNADLVTSGCDGTNQTRLDYVDSGGVDSYFACVSIGPQSGYIASGSARLTSDEITVTSCSFVCRPQEGSIPTNITVSLTGTEPNVIAVESSTVSMSTTIFLRNY